MLHIYEDLRTLRIRLGWWRFVVILLFACLILRYWQLQVVRHTTYQKLARANHVRPIPEAAPRGLILDRYGRILGENRPSFNLILDEKTDLDVLELVQRYVSLPDLDELAISESRVEPVIIKQDMLLEEVARIEARQLELRGVRVQFVPLRHYPNAANAAHALGYVGPVNGKQLELEEFSGVTRIDFVGQSGVERSYNRLLMGDNGVQRVVVNSLGRRERVLEQVPPVWGETVQLSIDLDLQKVAEEAFGEQAGAIAAIDPRNGEVLAIGSLPSFDPNIFMGRVDPSLVRELMTHPRTPLQNRAIQGRYPPGSTFKVAVAAAALEQELITPESRMYCSGAVRLYGNVFHCHRAAGHGSVNLIQALAQSCNSYFYQLGAKLQIDTIARHARMLGLGAATRIDLPHEVSGLIPDPEWKRRVRNEPWYAGESISVAVGQGSVLVTALQMARLAATVGSSGEVHRPRLFLRKLPTGTLPSPYPDGVRTPPTRRVEFRDQTWRAIQEGMFDAVNGVGTAGRARVQGVSVSGKTGTAQVASRARLAARNEDRPYRLRTHAWFIGYAPRVNPEIAIAVVVEHGGGGGRAAAPIAQKVFDAYFNHDLPGRRRARPTTVAGN